MALFRYLDPKNDVAFKKIFGSEKNKDILIHFLNDILGSFKNSNIIEIEFLPTILNPNIASQKLSIIDVLCKDENGAKYIIEMQVTHSKGFEKRAQHYAAKVYSEQAKVGAKYQNLKEIIFIAISDCIIFPKKSHYKSDHIILDKTTYEHDLKDFYFTFIELPKFNKNKEELSSIEEKWCYFFKHAHETAEADLLKIIGNDTIIHRAYTALNHFYWTENELRDYEDMNRVIMDNMAVMEQKIDDVKMEIAKRLLQNGVGMDVIAQSSDLSKEQIEDLQKYTLDENIAVNF
ncbi:MAG: Rpn family recombination-promoting nuclease/putative transposase [Candidatus Rhabdochlamydia sp.]